MTAVARSRRRYWIGTSGWYYWHWRNDFYAEVPQNQWFKHYQKFFRTVELNAPFYRWPKPTTMDGWRRQVVATTFLYAIKVNNLITHFKKFVNTREDIERFCSQVHDKLGARLGCFLFQCPPSMVYNPERLDNILGQLDPKYRNVLEFRHRSWWNEEVYEKLRERDVIFCSVSAPRLPEDLIQTSPDIYVRFHGRKRWYNHDYTRDELAVWAKKIKAAPVRNAWLFFNNDRNGYAVRNSRSLMRLLGVRIARSAAPAEGCE